MQKKTNNEIVVGSNTSVIAKIFPLFGIYWREYCSDWSIFPLLASK